MLGANVKGGAPRPPTPSCFSNALPALLSRLTDLFPRLRCFLLCLPGLLLCLVRALLHVPLCLDHVFTSCQHFVLCLGACVCDLLFRFGSSIGDDIWDTRAGDAS